MAVEPGSFLSDFLGSQDDDELVLQPRNSGSIAIARDYARQINGDIITNNTYNLAPHDSVKANQQKLHDRVMEWLTPHEALQVQASIHRDARNSRAKDTGGWFLKGKAFRAWLTGTSKLTWVHGIVGCGKTVLFSSAVERTQDMCREDPTKRVCSFYCTARDDSGQKVDVILRSILIQLCSPVHIPKILQHLFDSCNQSYSPKIPTTTELVDAVSAILENASPVSPREATDTSSFTNGSLKLPDIYILVDGIDELPWNARQEFLHILNSLALSGLKHVHLLATSRTQPDIQEAMTKPLYWDRIAIEEEMVQTDIQLYVDHTIETSRLRLLLPSTKDAIRKRLVAQGKGMFLWASLQLGALKRLDVSADQIVLNMLGKLPSDLDSTYYTILRRIHPHLICHASKALAWLVYSVRPLYIEELVHACSIRPEELKFSNQALLDDILTPYNLFEILHGLVSIHPPLRQTEPQPTTKTHSIVLIHASVAEFLQKAGMPGETNQDLSPFGLEEQQTHTIIAKSCLAYLCIYNTDRRQPQSAYLLDYAYWNWEKHVDKSIPPDHPVMSESIVRGRAIRLYQDLLDQCSQMNKETHSTDLTPVSMASGLGGNSLTDRIRNNIRLLLHGDRSRRHSKTRSSKPSNPSELRFQTSRKPAISQLTDCLPPYLQSVLKDALNTPLFYPGYETFSSPTDNDRFFEYSKLEGNEVRVLEILPCLDVNSRIRCKLSRVNLDEKPEFVALSYAWFSGHTAEYEDTCAYIHGCKVMVLPSQARWLRILRTRTEGSISAIWLDGLCINQHDHEETGKQVDMIPRISAEAKEVVVGLGDEIDSDAQAVAVMERLAAFSRTFLGEKNYSGRSEIMNSLHRLGHELENSAAWSAVAALFRDTWWERLWVVQEIALAVSAVALIGSLSLSFGVIDQAATTIAALERRLDQQSLLQFPSFASLLSHKGWKAAEELILTRRQIRRGGELPLSTLLWRFRHRKTSLPMDKIYGLLGLCRPSDADSIRMDYSRPAEESDVIVAGNIINTHRNLDILSIRSGFSNQGEGRPSWAPTWASPSPRTPLIVGHFDWPQQESIYSASGQTGNTRIRLLEGGLWLNARGQTFATIVGLFHIPLNKEVALNTPLLEALISWYKTSCREGNAPQQDYRYKTLEEMEENMLRTTTADQWPAGQRADAQVFSRSPIVSLQHFLEEFTGLGSQRFVFLIGRSFILTSEGYLGLGPHRARTGDEIAVLEGGSVPYVLRQRDTSDGYNFIGECYVHGCMDGEVPARLPRDENGDWTRDILIR